MVQGNNSQKSHWSPRFIHNRCRWPSVSKKQRDLTLVPPKAGNIESEESDSDSQHDDQGQPMRAIVRPTLCPRQTLKFPRLPIQATQQKDFKL